MKKRIPVWRKDQTLKRLSDLDAPVAVQNTDRELWREPHPDPPGDYYANSIHVTAGGGIGINVGGTVIVKSLAQWHALALPWRPINTLPTDRNAHVLVFTARGRMLVIHMEVLLTSMETTTPANLKLNPTHWMPLPDPPASGTSEGA